MNQETADLCQRVDSAVRRGTPPFRAEHIGSLLRPQALLDARARFARGEMAQGDLTAAEDDAIRDVIALQRQLGFRFVIDGEFRRRSYHSFFYQQLGDIMIDVVDGAYSDVAKAGRRGAQPMALIKSRVHWTHPINVADFAFLNANKVDADVTPKMRDRSPAS